MGSKYGDWLSKAYFDGISFNDCDMIFLKTINPETPYSEKMTGLLYLAIIWTPNTDNYWSKMNNDMFSLDLLIVCLNKFQYLFQQVGWVGNQLQE